MKIVHLTLLVFVACWSAGLSGVAHAKDEVGSLIALRGKAVIERTGTTTAAKVKEGILFNDALATREASRAKVLFIDDSVLSMAENSKVVIKEFLYSREKGGKSIFNLLDGKMKAVVGRTNFEVHTPTAVAAARGTTIYFEEGIKDGKRYTLIICGETDKELVITSPDPKIKDTAVLTTGMMIIIFEGEPFPLPMPAPASEIERLESLTEITDFALSIPGPFAPGTGWLSLELPYAPTIDQPPLNKTTPVTIDLIFK
ncbi:MAG: FecR family protein [Nitrospirae bacterium]|nr:FecR family protein [Nitrospirota bacterium]